MPAAADPATQQERWQKVVNDPLLSELPYKVETNHRGQIILSPHSLSHSDLQGKVLDLLRDHFEEGRALPELPVCTNAGVKQVDVAWVSADRLAEMKDTGDPPTLAPQLCVEVMSDSNTMDERHEKRALYREGGAEEVWIVHPDGRVQFFAEEALDQSALAPSFPNRLSD
jgi:Uma2 family endonuclease